MSAVQSFGAYDSSWMTDPQRSKNWGQSMGKFKKTFDEKRKAFPQINGTRWLTAIDAAKFVKVGDEFFAAIPKSALPEGVHIDKDYWIIEVPFLNEDQLAYSLSQYGMDIYGR